MTGHLTSHGIAYTLRFKLDLTGDITEMHDVLCLDGQVASKSRVIKEMGTHTWIHLACHAIQELSNPRESGFYLDDKRLELGEIIHKNLPNAEFAFLSACQTSMGNEKLSEEAVHPAGGMLAAGYRGVVATMWSIQDHYGPKIAADFYANLLSRGKQDEGNLEGLQSSAAAPALHFATQQIRKALGDSEASVHHSWYGCHMCIWDYDFRILLGSRCWSGRNFKETMEWVWGVTFNPRMRIQRSIGVV